MSYPNQLKQFSRLDMLLATPNSGQIFRHSLITIISTNKRKKKFSLKNSFRAYYSQLHNVRLWFASKIFIGRVPICTTMQLQTLPGSSGISDSLTFYLPLSPMSQLNWFAFSFTLFPLCFFRYLWRKWCVTLAVLIQPSN